MIIYYLNNNKVTIFTIIIVGGASTEYWKLVARFVDWIHLQLRISKTKELFGSPVTPFAHSLEMKMRKDSTQSWTAPHTPRHPPRNMPWLDGGACFPWIIPKKINCSWLAEVLLHMLITVWHEICILCPRKHPPSNKHKHTLCCYPVWPNWDELSCFYWDPEVPLRRGSLCPEWALCPGHPPCLEPKWRSCSKVPHPL